MNVKRSAQGNSICPVLALLSPGLVLFLYGSDHLGERIGLAALLVSVILIAFFFRMAGRKGDRALIDLRLFRSRTFSASATTQFMSNGISFAGQMLIPIYLIRGGGQSPSATGWLLAPLGLGMICSYPWMGALTQRFGIRTISAGGALLAFAATLPFLYLASHGLVLAVLACALFLRGVGLSAVGIPSISAAYASVRKQDLPMATTSLNIVQRLGGPTLTTLCATFLGWRLGLAQSSASLSSAFTVAFLLLCGLHAFLFAAALRLPLSLDKATEPLAEESPALTTVASSCERKEPSTATIVIFQTDGSSPSDSLETLGKRGQNLIGGADAGETRKDIFKGKAVMFSVLAGAGVFHKYKGKAEAGALAGGGLDTYVGGDAG